MSNGKYVLCLKFPFIFASNTSFCSQLDPTAMWLSMPSTLRQRREWNGKRMNEFSTKNAKSNCFISNSFNFMNNVLLSKRLNGWTNNIPIPLSHRETFLFFKIDCLPFGEGKQNVSLARKLPPPMASWNENKNFKEIETKNSVERRRMRQSASKRNTYIQALWRGAGECSSSEKRKSLRTIETIFHFFNSQFLLN